jgi:hypothetical protein
MADRRRSLKVALCPPGEHYRLAAEIRHRISGSYRALRCRTSRKRIDTQAAMEFSLGCIRKSDLLSRFMPVQNSGSLVEQSTSVMEPANTII